MRLRLFIVISVASILVGCKTTHWGPLSFPPPEGWKASFDEKKLEYRLRLPNEALLGFSTWRLSTTPEEFPGLVRKVAEKFKDDVQDGKFVYRKAKVSVTHEEMRIEVLHGKSVIGNYILFDSVVRNEKLLVAVFIFKMNSTVWKGQFVGTPENWPSALKTLQSVHESPPEKLQSTSSHPAAIDAPRRRD